MDANYLKNNVGVALTAALASFLSHPHPNSVSDPINHIGFHLLHQDATRIKLLAENTEILRVRQIVEDAFNHQKEYHVNWKKCSEEIGEAVNKRNRRLLQNLARKQEAEAKEQQA